jgi:hypothetical protein
MCQEYLTGVMKSTPFFADVENMLIRGAQRAAANDSTMLIK